MDLLLTLDWAALLKIIGIDIMLGVDNAILIALACSAIPDPALRRRAVLIGTAGAIGLRAVLLGAAGLLLAVPYLKLIAGAYLLWIGYQLLTASDDDHAIQPADRVIQAVKTIIVADFMMSLDNVLGVAAAAQGAGQHATAYAIAGIALSIPIIIFGATTLLAWMDRWPLITWLGGGLLGWVGVDMIITDPAITLAHAHHLPAQLAGALLVIGLALRTHGQRRTEAAA